MNYENTYIVAHDGKSLHPGDKIGGFEVIQNKMSEGDGSEWVMLLPTQFNARTINEIERMMTQQVYGMHRAVVHAVPDSQHQSEFGNIAIEILRVVDNNPQLNVNYIDTNETDYNSTIFNTDITRIYELSKPWKHTKISNFVTFSDLKPSFTRCGTTIISETQELDGRMKTKKLEYGILGLRMIPGCAGNMRVIVPDIMTPVTFSYLNMVIGRFIESDDANWRYYPTFVKAKELRITPIGLPELQIEYVDTNVATNIIKQLFQKSIN